VSQGKQSSLLYFQGSPVATLAGCAECKLSGHRRAPC
jgi:hypothetical protein